jgi:hypothetical protein
MTVKEIAEAVGKDETNIRRWIKKFLTGKMPVRNEVLDDKMSLRNDVLTGKMQLRTSIAEKAEHSSPENPADYDVEEVLLIIEAGLGKNAAGIFRANLDMAAKLAEFKGLRADLQKFLENNSQKALPDPSEAANRELAGFVREHLTITGKHAQDFVSVSTLYDMYRGYVDRVLPERTFMYKIVLDNPAIELKIRRYSNDLTGCCYRH